MALTTKSYRRAAEGMTIVEHLQEARKRIMIIFLAVFILGTAAFIDYNQILNLLRHPLCQVAPNQCTFLATGPLDGLSVRVKIALYAGFLFATPVVFYQLWRFITPGLKAQEKRYVIPFVSASVGFFAGGCVVAYFTFKHALEFLRTISGDGFQFHYTATSYLSLIVLMMVLFGVVFEFPVVLVTLEMLNLVSPNQLLHSWRWAMIGITIAAGVLTPSSDPFSMMAMALPLVLFYFGAIGFGKLLGK